MLLKILGIILGIFLVSGGTYCIAAPDLTVGTIATIIPVFIGVSVLFSGIDRFCRWLEIKREGEKDGFTFAEGILGILCGIFFLASDLLKASMSLALIDLMPVFTAAGLLSFGIITICRAFQMKRANEMATVMKTNIHFSWGVELVLGILITLVGIFSALNPLTTLLTTGTIVGIDIISSGIMLIVTSLAF